MNMAPIIVTAALLIMDHGQYGKSTPEMKTWFDSLRSGKGPCCSVSDGVTITDADWESRGGHYRVRVPRSQNSLEMIWVDVPDEAVITEPNRVGRTIVWPIWIGGSSVSIRCFMPGTMT